MLSGAKYLLKILRLCLHEQEFLFMEMLWFIAFLVFEFINCGLCSIVV